MVKTCSISLIQISLEDEPNQLNDSVQHESMNFTNLNEDIHYLVLENLILDDLMRFAQTNKYFSILAASVFQTKCSKKIVEVLPFLSDQNGIHDTGDRLYIKHPQTISRFLRQFGGWIHKMKVNYRESYYDIPEVMKKTSELINLYCSDSLTELVVSDKDAIFVSQITKPFKRVEYLEIVGDFNNLNGLNEKFPAMKNLSLPSTTINNMTSIYHHFANLVELNVNFFDGYSYGQPKFQESEIEEVLKKNPQIRSLKMHGPTEYILRVASELLPDLEYIRIEPSWSPFEISDSVPKFLFKNVKTLELKVIRSDRHIKRFPASIEFENLEELRSTISSKSGFGWWIDFIQKNKHLKKFYSIDGCINNADLIKFAQITNNLKEISVTLCENVEGSSVVKLVEANQQVERFNFNRKIGEDKSFEIKAQHLRKTFGPTMWAITNTVDYIQINRM